MVSTTEHAVASRLANLRPALIAAVADQLAAQLPMVGIDQQGEGRAAAHHQRMQATAERFHELVLLGATTDWSMVSYEYRWTARVLGPLGITWDHQRTLIASYFAVAERSADWGDEERAVLKRIGERFVNLGAECYN